VGSNPTLTAGYRNCYSILFSSDLLEFIGQVVMVEHAALTTVLGTVFSMNTESIDFALGNAVSASD
jgi:hypothetical protein